MGLQYGSPIPFGWANDVATYNQTTDNIYVVIDGQPITSLCLI